VTEARKSGQSNTSTATNKETQNMPTIVAFLDVLGFANYTQEDLLSAQMLLSHQQFILSQKLNDGTTHPPSSYSDSGVARLAESNLADSFQHFLPFSDSTFIVSAEPDKFIRQLSHFLISCVKLVDHAYSDPEDPAHPESVTIKEFGTGQTSQERWYPPLWRGGIATRDLRVFDAIALVDHNKVNIPNLAGSAVVKAARLEKNGRGPRLFCANDFKENFGEDIRPYFQPIKNSDSVSELLWPAFLYADGTNPRVDMNDFFDLWSPAIGLWKSKKGQVSFEHYDEYLRLLIRSLMCWASRAGIADKAKEFVEERIRLDLGEALIEDYMV
jgi:hypothetical protein